MRGSGLVGVAVCVGTAAVAADVDDGVLLLMLMMMCRHCSSSSPVMLIIVVILAAAAINLFSSCHAPLRRALVYGNGGIFSSSAVAILGRGNYSPDA
jgi:hypothetical protein